MYRVLREHGEVGERRRQATHPATVKPELVATAPNVVWSWDITKLLGPEKWTWFYLYVIIHIYSRYVPGWMLARAERANLAEALLEDTIRRQRIERHQLTIHADRGSSMASDPSLICSPTSVSPRATAGPAARTTTPTARASSAP
jgi:putative transposase